MVLAVSRQEKQNSCSLFLQYAPMGQDPFSHNLLI